MSELSHRIRVFVFRFAEGRPNYLLLKGAQGIESFWTPLHGPVNFDEKMESAIRREVADEIGYHQPHELIDLKMPARWLLGDEEVIEWTFGLRAPRLENDLQLGSERWADFRWAPFAHAYPSLELEVDRAAIMRLHALLHAA